ncbi:hypothetical protein JB92DRAFT_2817793 [Gautieria morchelliformis]|nr:hypothetical protein JB92DRAFT_2817793 [Gautieria morchelliformis]
MVSSVEAGVQPSRNIFKLFFVRTSKDYLIGISLLLVVVVLWTLSGFITQNLFVNGYHKPFLVTYFNTSSFSFYLLPFLFRYWWKSWNPVDNNSQANLRDQYEVLPTFDQDVVENGPLQSGRAPLISTAGETDPDQLVPLTTPETASLASFFCLLWFIANWTVNASLDYTSVASSTVLSSTSSFFTLAIGRLFVVESPTPTKLVAVLISFIGVLLVSLSDKSSSDHDAPVPIPSLPTLPRYANPLLGDVLALASAIFYALYVILLKVRIRSESRIDMQLFFGFVGAINIVALFPLILIMHFTGYEPFEFPSTGKAWGAVLVNMFITLCSDYLYVIAMLKTTPVVVTVGLSLTIPLAIIGDEILNIHTKAQAGFGALLVLVSFGLVGWENADNVPQQDGQADNDQLQGIPQVAPVTRRPGSRDASVG